MNTCMPPALAPYIQECINSRSLTLLTSVLDTPTNWLVVRLLYQALNCRSNTVLTSQGALPSTTGFNVVLISIWRSFDVWNEISKKCGLNLSEKIAAKQLCYIDGLSTNTSAPSKQPGQVIPLKSLTLRDLNNAISTAVQSFTNQPDTSKTVLIIDGIDFLLACDPACSAIDMKQTLVDLQSRSHSVIVTSAADGPLLHSMEPSATSVEYEHGFLTRQLAYQARLIFQLRPLETGHSKDVSGTVRISRGGAWEEVERDKTRELEEQEWLYQFKGDGTVKVWGRGEA